MKAIDLRAFVIVLLADAVFIVAGSDAQAQRMDVAFGVNTMDAPSASEAGPGHSPQSLNGGAYPVFSSSAQIYKRVGVGGEIAWKGSEGVWGGYQPYRPIFWDFNAVWLPRLARRTYADLQSGIGAESIRFYTPYSTCNFVTCTNYVTSNHFMGHFAAGFRLYPIGNFFIRPEAHLYLVNNNVEFSSSHAVRYGMSIGYSFGGR